MFRITIGLLCVGIALLFCSEVDSARPSRDRNVKNFRLVCYLGSWAYYRNGNGKYEIQHIDVNACTHLVYGFAKLENDRITPYDPYLDLKEQWGKDYFGHFNRLREQNPNLSTIIAIGGWNEGSKKYSDMAKDPARRRVFVQSVLDFLKKYDFDGLDFDWEYPGSRDGSRVEDKANFILCLKELKEAFQPYGYILTAAVSAGKHTIQGAYDIPAMSKYLDIINLMAYDYHGSWEQVTGHNSPLFPRPEESFEDKMLNVNFSVNYWLSKGAPADKLVLGMPLYGRCFTLSNPAVHGLGAPAPNKGKAWPHTNDGGMVGYNEICEFLRHQGWQNYWDPSVQAPYAVKGDQWCGYDDPKSLAIKTHFLKEKGLGGGMVWSLETDDFRNFCGQGHNVLIWTIHNTLSGGSVIPDRPTTLPPVTVHSACQAEGKFAIPGECSKYLNCLAQPGGFRELIQNCPPGTSFDDNTKSCRFSNEVAGCGKPKEPTTEPHTTTPSKVTPTTTVTVPSTCRSEGKFAIPGECSKYLHCVAQPSGFRELIQNCPPGTSFDDNTKTCRFSNEVTGCGKPKETTTKPTTTTTTGPIVPSTLKCDTVGIFPHPVDCRKFYNCLKGKVGFKVVVFTCPAGLVFNRGNNNCDYPKNVPQCLNPNAPRLP